MLLVAFSVFGNFVGTLANRSSFQRALRGNTTWHYEEEDLGNARALTWATRQRGDDNIRITFSNITSLHTKVAAVATCAETGLHVVVETKADVGVMGRAAQELKAFHASGSLKEAVNVVWGEPVSRSAGVALFEGGGTWRTTKRLEAFTPAQKFWQTEGRLAAFRTTMRVPKRSKSDAGKAFVNIVVVYGQLHKLKENEELIRAVDVWVKSFSPSQPTLVVGDFNLEWHESNTFWQWKTERRMVDLHEWWAMRQGKAPGATTTERRIDLAWGNATFRNLICDLKIVQRFATHSSIEITLAAEAFVQVKRCRQRPPSLPLKKAWEATPEQLAELLQIRREEWRRSEEQARQSVQVEEKRAGLDNLLDIWSERGERYLALVGGIPWLKRLHKRGRVQPIKTQTLVPAVTRTMESSTSDWLYTCEVQEQTILRRLEALERMQIYGPQLVRTWANARRGLILMAKRVGWCDVFFVRDIPNHEQLVEYKSWLHRAIQSEVWSMHSKLRRDKSTALRGRQGYAFVCKQYTPPVTFVGGTCDLEEIDAAVWDYWIPIWQDPSCQVPPAPVPVHLQADIMQKLPKLEPWQLKPLTPAAFKRYLQKTGGAAGACGWLQEELKALPDELLEQLCSVFELMEELGIALSVACEGDVSLIPKSGEDGGVANLRPITVLAVTYRLWAGARLRLDLFNWQNKVFENFPLRACRPLNSTHDLTIPVSLELEAAYLDQVDPPVGESYDLAKAFDSMPFGIGGWGWILLQRFGMPPPIIAVLQDLYARIKRRFKIRGSLGKPMAPEGLRACIQGCALSMVCCNVVTLVWFHLQRKGLACSEDAWRELQLAQQHLRQLAFHNPLIALAAQVSHALRIGGYADDLHALSRDRRQAERAHFLTLAWVVAMGMKLNAKKSMSFGELKLKVDGVDVPTATILKLLGNLLEAHGLMAQGAPDRLAEAFRRVRRVALLPGSRKGRTDMISSTVLPVLYGFETAQYEYKELRDLRSAVWQGVRGGLLTSRAEAIEVLMTVCCKGHRTDPVQYIDHRTVMLWAGWLNKVLSEDDYGLLQRVWQAIDIEDKVTAKRRVRGDTLKNAPRDLPHKEVGSATHLYQVLASLGWKWPAPKAFKSPIKLYVFPLARTDKEEMDHSLREALRRREIEDTISDHRRGGLPKRPDFEGVQEGVDWTATRAVFGELEAFDLGILTTILAGGVLTMERLIRHKRLPAAVSPNCRMPGCQLDAPETREHRIWHCSCHEHLRTQRFMEIRNRLAELRPCEALCGLVLIDSFWKADVKEVHRVLIAIEKAARGHMDAIADEVTPPPPTDDPDDAAPSSYRWRGGAGRPSAWQESARRPGTGKGGGKQPRALVQPASPHPPASLTFDNDEGTVTCSRCGRFSRRSHSTAWATFWEAECFELKAGRRHNTERMAQSYWANKGTAKKDALCEWFKKEHNAAGVIWSGGILAPVTCTGCHNSWPFMILRRDKQKGVTVEKCARTLKKADERKERLAHYLRQRSTHKWRMQPNGRMLVCERCGFYMHDVPAGSNASRSYASKPCGVDLNKPWQGVKFEVTKEPNGDENWAWYMHDQ